MFALLRKCVFGRFAVLWMGVAVQVIHYLRDAGLYEHMVTLNLSTIGFWLATIGYPSPDIADISTGALSALMLALVAGRPSSRSHLKTSLITWGCMPKSQIHHHNPDSVQTYDVWFTGRFCRGEEQQILAVQKALEAYQLQSLQQRCATACMGPLRSESFRWHGYLTSAPAGQTPDGGICEPGSVIGVCPGDGKHEIDQDGLHIEMIADFWERYKEIRPSFLDQKNSSLSKTATAEKE